MVLWENVGQGLAVHPGVYGYQYADETRFLAPKGDLDDLRTLHHEDRWVVVDLTGRGSSLYSL